MRADEVMTLKPGLEAEYSEYVAKNQDGYGNGVVVAGSLVGKALDENRSPSDAMDATNEMGITGFMAGCVASSISHFHPRGEEFRRWWNTRYQIGTEGDKANESGGVLNPAILTIG